MQRERFPIGHFLLVCGCLVLLVAVWLIPVAFTGFSFTIPALLSARNFAATGIFSVTDSIGRVLSPSLLPMLGALNSSDGRLSDVLYAALSHWIPFSSTFAWTLTGAVLMAAALALFWLAAVRVFGKRIAWIALVLSALTPLYWQQALMADPYKFAFLFFFASFAAFVWIAPRSRLLAVLIAGIFFGLSVSAKDVFLTFLPWFVLAYIWMERHRWKNALTEIILFSILAGGIYLLPYMGDIRTLGYPANHNLARLWPGARDLANGTYLHLYPDPYTYHFDRERFDTEHLKEVASQPLITRLQNGKTLLNYGLVSGTLLSIGNGAWLLLNSLPSFAQQGRMGGIVFWLFLIPGLVVLWKRDRRLTILLGGLIVSSYFIVSFVLHYEREHLMDVVWAVELFVAVGILVVSEMVAASSKRISSGKLAALIAGILCVQLVQANRFEFAELYRRTSVPQVFVQAEMAKGLSEDAVVALPLHTDTISTLAYMSGRTFVRFDEATVKRLLTERRLAEAFKTYGITHVLGYAQDTEAAVKRQMPSVVILVPAVTGEKVAVSPFLNYLLHTVR
ncbi:MAG: hypothetical protein PHH13_01130 [Candidatus Peribacteraceae bacterium]|nr:hypothetical protein [Candidatus Peribacteraceae bacterium]